MSPTSDTTAKHYPAFLSDTSGSRGFHHFRYPARTATTNMAANTRASLAHVMPTQSDLTRAQITYDNFTGPMKLYSISLLL